MPLPLLACTPNIITGTKPDDSHADSADTDSDTDADTGTDTDSDSDADADPWTGTYPAQRVGTFYLLWHAYAYDAAIRSPGYTIEQALRSDSLDFSDLVHEAGLYRKTQAFHWHQGPSLGYNFLRPRPGEAPYA